MLFAYFTKQEKKRQKKSQSYRLEALYNEHIYKEIINNGSEYKEG